MVVVLLHQSLYCRNLRLYPTLSLLLLGASLENVFVFMTLKVASSVDFLVHEIVVRNAEYFLDIQLLFYFLAIVLSPLTVVLLVQIHSTWVVKKVTSVPLDRMAAHYCLMLQLFLVAGLLAGIYLYSIDL
jgi:hypothetical protein